MRRRLQCHGQCRVDRRWYQFRSHRESLVVPTSSGSCLLGKTVVDLPALRGALWTLMKPEFISLEGVRNPVEGLVKASVEPVFSFSLDNQVDEELKIGSVNSEHHTGNFACTNLASTSQSVTSNLGGLEIQWCSCANYSTPQLALNPSLCWIPKYVSSIESSLTLSTTVLCRESTPFVEAPTQLCTSSAVPTSNSPNDLVISILKVLVFPCSSLPKMSPSAPCWRTWKASQQEASVDAIADREKIVKTCNFVRGSPGMTVTGRLCPALQAGHPACHF